MENFLLYSLILVTVSILSFLLSRSSPDQNVDEWD